MKSLALVLAATALSSPYAAFAAEPEATSEQRAVARVVEIRVSGDAAALARVRMTARELLLRLDVQPIVKPIDEAETSSSEPVPLVLAYVDLRSTSSPSIDIEDGKTRQELTRRHLSDVSSLETGVEALLHVLYLTVESTLQVGVVPTARPASVERKPAPPAQQPAAAPSRAHFGFDVGPLLRLSSMGADRFVPGAGAQLEPRVEVGRGQLGLLLSGALHASTALKHERGEASVRPIQVRIVPTLDWPLAADVSSCFGLGLGLDSLIFSPEQAPDAGRIAGPQSVLDPLLSALVGARVPLSGRVFLSALASLDLDLAPTSFVAHAGTVREPLLALPRVRGGFTLALSFTAAGARRFAKAQQVEP